MPSTTVSKIKIKHSGNFIIDTVAPDGTVLINGGESYTKSNQVTVSLDANDSTTGVKDIEARNTDIVKTLSGEQETNYDFIPLEYRENFLWSLPEEEGFKKVEVKFRDYAHNVSEFVATTNNRKFFSIDEKIIDKLVKIGFDYYSSAHGSDGSVYVARHFPTFLDTFTNQDIKDIVENGNVLYVATDGAVNSTVYGYIDGEFVSLNTFSPDILNMTSYDGDLYVVLANNELYKKDSSAWFSINTFTRDVAYIAADDYFLYVFFTDGLETIEVYNGVSFSELNVSSHDVEVESEESSSESTSSLSSSSTREGSSSTITESLSSNSSLISSSTQSQSTSSTSTEVMSSSASSDSSSDSSSLLESSKSIPSSESISSESYMAQFSDSSEITSANPSSESSSTLSSSSSSSSSSKSSSSGNPCDCGTYTSSSIYIGGFDLRGMTDKYTSGCNLFGTLLSIGGGLARVLLYRSSDKSESNEVARSADFFSGIAPQETVVIQESNNSGITGSFNYVTKYSKTTPHNFVVLCEGNNTSSQSSSSVSSSDSERSSSQSQDPLIGDGTPEDPYRVTSSSHLSLVNIDPSAYYRLDGNIYMSDTDNFVPIGSETVPFTGDFNGNGYRISFLNIEREDEDNIGLFGYTEDAEIYDIEVIDCNVVGSENVGAVIGNMVGGLLQNASCGSSISGTKNVGGLVGKTSAGATIINCYSKANSSASSRCGGLVGERGTSSSVVNCYSTGFVSGGFSGGLISRDYSESGGGGEVVSSYWDTETSGTTSSVGGTGRTTMQMQSQSTYAGWDFTNTWSINANINEGYPYLQSANAPEEDSSVYPVVAEVSNDAVKMNW